MRLLQSGFLSTLSLRRATIKFVNLRVVDGSFLSTLSLRRATSLLMFWLFLHCRFLSTLSLRRATKGPAKTAKADRISIHALLAESDVGCSQGRWQPDGFLSTLSLRRATMRHRLIELWKLNFYPRSPCGERP